MYGRTRWRALLVCLREDLETSVRERPLLGVGPMEGVRPWWALMGRGSGERLLSAQPLQSRPSVKTGEAQRWTDIDSNTTASSSESQGIQLKGWLIITVRSEGSQHSTPPNTVMDIVFAESYQLGFYAHGLNPDKIKEYTCRYKLDEIQVYSKYPGWCFPHCSSVLIANQGFKPLHCRGYRQRGWWEKELSWEGRPPCPSAQAGSDQPSTHQEHLGSALVLKRLDSGCWGCSHCYTAPTLYLAFTPLGNKAVTLTTLPVSGGGSPRTLSQFQGHCALPGGWSHLGLRADASRRAWTLESWLRSTLHVWPWPIECFVLSLCYLSNVVDTLSPIMHIKLLFENTQVPDVPPQ